MQIATATMASNEIGSVRVDLNATRARYEAGASTGVKHDIRPILYTNELQSTHRYVCVKLRDTCGFDAFAQLRPSTDGTNWVSMGLLASLGLEEQVYGQRDGTTHVDVAVSALLNQDQGEKTKCKCTTGSIVQLRLHFATRPRPSCAIVEGLQRAVPSFLHGIGIWKNRRCIVSWFNVAELVTLEDVVTANTRSNTGCCSAIGMCSTETNVTLSFKNDTDATDVVSVHSFKAATEYSRRVEDALGGVGDHAARLLSAIVMRLTGESTTKTPESSRAASSVGAILSGLPGVGKTALAKAICDSVGVHVRFLNAADVFQTYVGHSEAQIVKTIEELGQHAPSILVVDGLESVATSRQGFLDSDSTLEVGVLGTFIACLDKLKLSGARVFVLGTTSRMDDIDAAVYSNGRMDLVVRLEPPSPRDRCEILSRMTRGWAVNPATPDLLSKLSDATGGFVGADLLSMCQKALQICVNDPTTQDRRSPVILFRHFEEALSSTFPSVLQAHHVSLRQQHTSSAAAITTPFSGIYGVDEALKTITVSLLEPLEDCSRFLRFGTVPPKGILLTGPPGSGKTHLANVVATELRRRGLASFVSVRCTDLLTKVVGDTEKALRELFETARSAAPCVIYFDQIESIAPVRGFDTSTEQTFDRLLSMLLVEMDGFSTSRESLQQSMTSEEARSAFLKKHIVILASTNEKNQLDPAILRPGRFDLHIELNLPDRDAREQIIRDELREVPVDFSSDDELISVERLATFVADHTDGFTAGDLTSLLREAAMSSMRANFEATAVAIRFVKAALKQRQVLKQVSS